ncbi:MAG TPA: class I SAM-dependent methyltransferase [Bacillota bacterium]|nr:class I SAM-dependent methyltransferase [Bacillota bacterium]
MYRGLGSAVELAHLLISGSVGEGGTAVDATAGNGHDTVFLAGLVGAGGRVYALDIQERALENTRSLLEKSGLSERVTLVLAGHEELAGIVPGPVDAILFNLGFLPGGDRSVATKASTTVRALHSSAEILRPGGRIGLVVYTGHPGGREECEAVEKWGSALDPGKFSVIKIRFLNRAEKAPVVFVAEKRVNSGESQPSA